MWGLFLALCGGLYAIWWWSYTLILPWRLVWTDYAALVRHAAWIPVNLLEVAAVIAGFLFLVFYMLSHDTEEAVKTGKSRSFLTMLVLLAIGYVTYAGVAFYEAILWPIFAVHAPDTINVLSGAVYRSSLFNVSTMIGIICFVSGNILFGIRVMKRYSRVWGIVLIAGMAALAPAYICGGLRYVFQTIGVTLFGVASFVVGLKIWLARS